MVELTPEILKGLKKNGATDPTEYYRHPVVGHLFRERINVGLRLLGSARYGRALEVGYSAGAVLLALSPVVDELHGLDLDASPEPVNEMLARSGFSAKLVQGNVYQLPYDDGQFDLVVSFSVFEHLHEFKRGLSEVSRVLRPGGSFLLCMPTVSRWMEVAFRALGVKSIEDHHVTTPEAVAAEFGAFGFRRQRYETLDFPVKGVRLYHAYCLTKE